MKKLENLKWAPRWVSHMGCVKGCLDYLGVEVTDAWLYGATGHAFVLNVAEGQCPSGPTAWNTEMLSKLGGNVGYVVDGVFGSKSSGDLAEAQRKGWELVTRSIDEGVPCYGWEFDVPEFYVVFGYDREGYYFSGPGSDDGKGPKPWSELGDTGIGCLEMNAVKRGEPADDRKSVGEALEFALRMSATPNKWVLRGYKTGLAGYDSWIAAFEGGSASRFGTGYNSAVWSECRRFAIEFLEEAGERLGGSLRPLFAEAARQYRTVSKALAAVSDAYPFSVEHPMDPVPVDSRSAEAVSALREARNAEEMGLAVLAKIVEGTTGTST